MKLRIRRLSYPLGAEITGLDIREALDEGTVAAIRAAFLEHCVLLFRGVALTQAQHVAFSRRFGDLEKTPEFRTRDRVPAHPEILLVSNRPRPGESIRAYVGEGWHSDRSNTTRPAMASLLRAAEIPEVGGDTMFSNLYRAYETLSDGMKKMIAGLEGVHMLDVPRQVDTSTAERAAETRRSNITAQPLVRVHPETGRKALFVGEHKLKRIAGMSEEEGRPLIKFLCAHAARAQFIYRHRWQQDDLLMWDNRCTNHLAVYDFDRTKIRHMERTTVIGTPSGYPYEGPLS